MSVTSVSGQVKYVPVRTQFVSVFSYMFRPERLSSLFEHKNKNLYALYVESKCHDVTVYFVKWVCVNDLGE